MRKDTESAKKLLIDGAFTCVLVKDTIVYSSIERGVKPLMELIDNQIDCAGFCVCDKVVGKAAAFLYAILEVKEVYTFVISQSAKDVLLAHGIQIYEEHVVEAIRNRNNDGFCPMETAVWEIDNKDQAYEVIKKRMQKPSI